MDRRHYPNPHVAGQMLVIDLDDREPLTELEADTLNEQIHWMAVERAKLDEHIRKVTQRIVLSAEKKVRMMRDGS